MLLLNLQRESRFTSFPNCNPRTINACHLTCTNTKSTLISSINYCIAFNMTNHPPAKKHGSPFQISRMPLTYNFIILWIYPFLSRSCARKPPGTFEFLQSFRTKTQLSRRSLRFFSSETQIKHPLCSLVL